EGHGKGALQSAGKSGFERRGRSRGLARDGGLRAPDAARRKSPRRQGAARAWAFVSSTRRQRPGGENLLSNHGDKSARSRSASSGQRRIGARIDEKGGMDPG